MPADSVTHVSDTQKTEFALLSGGIHLKEDVNGEVRIADDVIAVTSAVAAAGVRGVASLVGGITDNITKNILRMNVIKGVKVSRSDEKNQLIIDIFVNIYYGYKIPEIAWDIQECVRKEVMKLTGETTGAVNIHVQGVQFAEESADNEGDNNEKK